MASKRAERRRSCDRKQVYLSRAEAWAAVGALKRHTGHKNISIYKCPFCGHFHIGHHALRRKPE